MKILIDLLKKREAVLALIILALIAVISSLTPNFLTYANITSVLKSYTVMGIFALGVLVVIINGNVDVSFTAIAQVTQYAVVYILIRLNGGNLFAAFIMAVVFGTLMGLFNGFLIHHYNMPGIIISIATQSLFYGLLFVITKGTYINEIPAYFQKLSDAKLFTVPNAEGGAPAGLNVVTLIWFFMAAGLSLFLRYTILGRSIYLTGSNKVAANRVGINLFKTTLLVYGIIGGIAAIGSIVHASNVQAVIPSSIVGQELQVIAAVVLGGASITGGRGTVLGTMLGVFLFAMLGNSLTLLKISSYWYNVFTGCIIIGSITINAVQELRQRKNIVRVKVAE
ncbi:MAG: ABC transporter permease [Spirochaetaceae bacterium]|jgi:simple sugar transport system permease protein|nr:ABC transporter permease [Spirochaetaceae bacterium]GMO22573.1 MAG: ABC transporter permease [Termitinemataceae bacterium]